MNKRAFALLHPSSLILHPFSHPPATAGGTDLQARPRYTKHQGTGSTEMKSEKISELTTSRLSVYLRCLNLLAAAGVKTVSSRALAEQFHLSSAQIRKDLAYFGDFGTRGVGYSVEELRRYLTQILGLDRAHRVAVVGAGNLGT